MVRLFVLCVVLCVLATTIAVPEENPEAAKKPTYEPSKTLIAVLPTVLKSAESAAQSQNAKEEAQKMLAEDFSERGFQIVAKDKLSDICAKRKFDPLDSECLTKESLAGVGAEAGAALVAYATLQSFNSELRNMAVVKVKVLDVQTQTYVVNETRKAENDKLRKKGRMVALHRAIENALDDFFKPYKAIKTDEQSKEN